jgi:hypothetical protein
LSNNISSLAGLLQQRNGIDQRIAEIIGQAAEPQRIADAVADAVFDIEPAGGARYSRFRSGPAVGKTVSVQYSFRQTGLLNLYPYPKNADLPDYFLVLTGPDGTAIQYHHQTTPFTIAAAYLFDGIEIATELRYVGEKLATGSRAEQKLWHAAMIYPEPRNPLLSVSAEQRTQLDLFNP